MALSKKTLEIIKKEKEPMKKFQILVNELSYRDHKHNLSIANIEEGICEIMDFDTPSFHQGLFDNRHLKRLT